MSMVKICQKLKIGNGRIIKQLLFMIAFLYVVMKLKYNDSSVGVTYTTNVKILNYKFQKLYYAIIIKNCNKYSSILNKQRIDVVMTDNEFRVLSIKRSMHENTVYENRDANIVILLPLNTFGDLKIGDYLLVSE